MSDRIISLILLILLSPVMAVIALLSLCVYGRKVFYSDERIGQYKRKFRILKFRTMHPWSQEEFNAYLSAHPEQLEQWQTNRKLNQDPRCTPWGLFLRHSSLDELPQLINILRGEMALVGPRPICEEEERIYGHYNDLLHSVKPGLTGLWQVSGRNLTSYHRRIALNIYYIRHRNWKLNLWILYKTVGAVFSGRGAY